MESLIWAVVLVTHVYRVIKVLERSEPAHDGVRVVGRRIFPDFRDTPKTSSKAVLLCLCDSRPPLWQMKYPLKSLTAKAKHDLLDASGFYKPLKTSSCVSSLSSSPSLQPLSMLSSLYGLSPPIFSIESCAIISSLYTYNDVKESKSIHPKVRKLVHCIYIKETTLRCCRGGRSSAAKRSPTCAASRSRGLEALG